MFATLYFFLLKIFAKVYEYCFCEKIKNSGKRKTPKNQSVIFRGFLL